MVPSSPTVIGSQDVTFSEEIHGDTVLVQLFYGDINVNSVNKDYPLTSAENAIALTYNSNEDAWINGNEEEGELYRLQHVDGLNYRFINTSHPTEPISWVPYAVIDGTEVEWINPENFILYEIISTGTNVEVSEEDGSLSVNNVTEPMPLSEIATINMYHGENPITIDTALLRISAYEQTGVTTRFDVNSNEVTVNIGVESFNDDNGMSLYYNNVMTVRIYYDLPE